MSMLDNLVNVLNVTVGVLINYFHKILEYYEQIGAAFPLPILSPPSSLICSPPIRIPRSRDDTVLLME